MPEAVRWRLRADLLIETVHFGRRLTHVVKDPVSGQFFHFDPRELAILKLLDGQRVLAEVFEAIRAARPDESFSADTLLRFLADARRNGLLLLKAGTVRPIDNQAPRKSWSLLSAKIPLFNPASWLAAVRPATGWLFSRTFLAAYVVVVLSALGLVTGRFEEVSARWPDAQAWTTPTMLTAILVVIAVCKVVHELAHALVADRFGVRVEECGVMLFYLLPCFYCDVSDAWLQRSARKRILVSAAGMLAELGLAAVATWLWWFSHPGPVQAICLAVMVSCSINTLLINGNPLMRFDGYFVLVDLLGLPNLAARARQWWGSAWERVVWGLPNAVEWNAESAWLAVYGATSMVYRTMVVAAVLWGIHQAFESRGAGIVSAGFLLVVAAGMIRGGVQAATRPLLDPLTRRLMEPRRAWLGAVILAGLLALAIVIPLPRSVRAEFEIEPVEAVPLFVQTPGVLKSIRAAGSTVAAGEIIAVLEDFPTMRRLGELETQRSLVERRLEAARVRRTVEPDRGQEIPALMESLAAVDERLVLARREVADLQVVAPCGGLLISPPNVPRKTPSLREAASWHGTPFDPANIGCELARGTQIATIAPTKDFCAVAFVSQRDIERVENGQQVHLALDGQANRPVPGVVSEISSAPVEQLPRELATTHRIPLQPGDRVQKPLEPMYRVRIRLDDPEAPQIVAALGSARIRGRKASAWRQGLDFLSDTFRFEM